MKIPYIALLAASLIIACSDDDSDTFLVRGDDRSYTDDEDDVSSSSVRSSSSSERRGSSSSEESSSSVQSSSSFRSSSSIARSSSSSNWLDTIPYIAPCRDDYEDNCKYGTLVDERDGQEYKTVYIGEQIWMAENLKYVSENSECYDDSLENCDVYGRLYPWADAIEVCPSGWHLPSLDEWKILFTYAGGVDVSASKLKSSYDWECYNCEGTDDYGFSVLPAGGYRTMYNGFRYLHYDGYFWTSTEFGYNDEQVYNMCFDDRDMLIDGSGLKFDNTFSVRCLKN